MIEAMKMQNSLLAGMTGKVKKVNHYSIHAFPVLSNSGLGNFDFSLDAPLIVLMEVYKVKFNLSNFEFD